MQWHCENEAAGGGGGAALEMAPPASHTILPLGLVRMSCRMYNM